MKAGDNMSEKVSQLPNLDIAEIRLMTQEARNLAESAESLRKKMGIENESDVIDPGLSPEKKPNIGNREADRKFALNANSSKSADQKTKKDVPPQKISNRPIKSTLADQKSSPLSAAKKSNTDEMQSQRKPQANTSPKKQEQKPKPSQSRNPDLTLSNRGQQSALDSDQDEIKNEIQNEIRALNQRLQEWQVAVNARLERVISGVASNLDPLSSETTSQKRSAESDRAPSLDEILELENALIRFGAEVSELLQKLASIPGVNTDSINFVQKISIVVVKNTDPEKRNRELDAAARKTKRNQKKNKRAKLSRPKKGARNGPPNRKIHDRPMRSDRARSRT